MTTKLFIYFQIAQNEWAFAHPGHPLLCPLIKYFLVSDPCGGVDDVDGKNSEATILDVFGQKDFIKIEYIIDPKGYFHITSEGKDRNVLVGHYKHKLRRDIPSSIDLRSATLVCIIVLLSKLLFQ